MRIRNKIFAVSLAMLMLAATACGNSAGSSSTAGSQGETPAGDTTTEGSGRSLTISLERQMPEVEEQRQKYFNEPLLAAFPDDNINIEIFADRQSLQVQVAGGSGPDIFHLDGPTDAVEFAKSDRVIDLAPYAAQYGWEELFYDWAWGTSYYGDKLVSLPNSFEGMVMYYNIDVLEANGWEKPNTAAELETLMKACQDAGIIPISFGNSDYQGAVDWLYSTFLSGYAGPDAVKEALQGTRKWDDDLIVGSINQMVNWWQEGYIGDKASQAITNDDMVALFADGKAAMMIDGTWASSQLLNTFPDCNWDVELVPELRDGVGRILPLATGGCFVVNSTSKDADFAAEVLDWIYKGSLDDHIKSVVEAGFQPYPIKSITMDDLAGIDYRMLDMYSVLFEGQQSGDVGYCSWTFYPSDARVYMNDNTDGLFLGSLSVEDYLAEVQTYVDNAIADGSAPTLS